MFLAKVTGSVVATQKTDSMVGHKLLVVEPYRLEANQRQSLVTTGRTFVAVDTVGAGDAFTAGLLVYALEGKSLADATAFANRLAARVAAAPGGTPSITRSEVER